MAKLTHILSQIEQGDPAAADQLLPLVYDELRRLAKAKMAREKPGQTLQATALVHEAYLRLVGGNGSRDWDSRGHFFAAAAEAMRRLLIERARHKQSLKAGGAWQRVDFDEIEPADRESIDLPALSDALDVLEAQDARKATIVKLRYFVGLTIPEAAHVLGISAATADNDWAYAKSWLKLRLQEPHAAESTAVSDASEKPQTG